MDIEHSIFTTGLDFCYSFHQNDTMISVSYPISSSVSASQIDFNFYDRCIYSGVKGKEPNICGMLYDEVTHEEHCVKEGKVIIKLQKSNVSIWPILIIKQSSQGIDPKSQFLLGVYNDAMGDEENAFSLIFQSAKRCFFPAQVLVADVLMSDANPYGVEKNVEQALHFLESIEKEYVTEEIIKTMVNACIELGLREKALEILKNEIDNSKELKKMYAKMLSPLSDKEGNQPELAVEYLNDLSKENDVEAIELLANHYSKGIGVKKDIKHSKELIKRINEIDPNYRKDNKISGIATNILVTIVLSSIFIGAASFVWYKKRKN